MKIVYLLLFLVVAVGCSSDDVEGQNILVGNWQLVEFCKDDGGGNIGCNTYEDGPVVELRSTGDFQHNGNNPNCMQGTFTVNDGKLTLHYENDECSVNNGLFVYDYTIEGQELTLLASEENFVCDELCYEVLRKIGDN